MLEGGVDSDDVYNFSWFNYGFLTVGYQFYLSSDNQKRIYACRSRVAQRRQHCYYRCGIRAFGFFPKIGKERTTERNP
jgi:hypothetical protein